MRRKSPPRVVGPYLERGKWRIVVVENNTRKSFFFLSEEEALKHATAADDLDTEAHLDDETSAEGDEASDEE